MAEMVDSDDETVDESVTVDIVELDGVTVVVSVASVLTVVAFV